MNSDINDYTDEQKKRLIAFYKFCTKKRRTEKEKWGFWNIHEEDHDDEHKRNPIPIITMMGVEIFYEDLWDDEMGEIPCECELNNYREDLFGGCECTLRPLGKLLVLLIRSGKNKKAVNSSQDIKWLVKSGKVLAREGKGEVK